MQMKAKIFQWMLAAILTCGAMSFTACSSSSDDDGGKTPDPKEGDLTVEKLVGFWITDFKENGTEGDMSWTRVVEDYFFRADGTGYYECYRLNGNKYVGAESVRDNGTLHYTISGNTVTITGDSGNVKWTLTYTDGKLTDPGQVSYFRSTAEQQTLIEQLYADWKSANSGGDDDDDKLNNVDGNVDINNGGGGVNVVRLWFNYD